MNPQLRTAPTIDDVDALISELEAEYDQIHEFTPADAKGRSTQALITTFWTGCCATF